MKVSHVKEIGYILPSGPKPLKQSQEQPQPSGVNETLCVLCFLNSPPPQLVTHSLSPVADAEMYFPPYVLVSQAKIHSVWPKEQAR